jgi:Ribose/xylose/arabinose/galactoside ABC-type transport systems, permease components
MADKEARDLLDDEPLTHAGAAVDDAPEQAPEAINDRSSRAIKGVLLALKAGPLFILALMMLYLWVATEGHVFMTFGNIGNVLEQSGGVCIIALGQLLVILTRGIDLSIGSNVSLCCVWSRWSTETPTQPGSPSAPPCLPASQSASPTASCLCGVAFLIPSSRPLPP